MTLEKTRKKIEELWLETHRNFVKSMHQSFQPTIPSNTINYFKNPKMIYESDWVPINYPTSGGG